MRKLIIVVLCLLLVPAASRAGTSTNPEIRDPAGDAPLFDYADLTSVWLNTMRRTDGNPIGFSVHFATVAAPDRDDDAGFSLSWNLFEPGRDDYRCWGSINVTRPNRNTSSDAPSYAELYYSCADNPGSVQAGPLFLNTQSAGYVPLAYRMHGNVVSVDVPYTAFTFGPSAQRYRIAGARLGDLLAASRVYDEPLLSMNADDTRCPHVDGAGEPPACSPRPFTLGS